MKGTYLKIIVLLSLFSCDPADNKLIVHNTSSKTVFFAYYPSHNELNKESAPYPVNKNGVLDSFVESRNGSYSQFVHPNESKNIKVLGQWENYFSPNDSILFIFLNEEIARNYSWEYIINNNRYNKVIKMSRNDLINNNWSLEYTGR